MRKSHAVLEGTVRDLADSPDPGEEFNCRCWAEPVSNEVPIPRRKPNCKQEEAMLEKAKMELETLKAEREKLIRKLQNLIGENNRIVRKMQIALGVRVTVFIIELPVRKLPFLTELIRRHFGNTISGTLLEKANRLAKERATIQRKAEQVRRQLRGIIEQLRDASRNLEEAGLALENCKNRIHGS